eukprot:1800196-Rhodomonas_salina.1
MGWTRIAIVFVNDLWGRAYSQDAASLAASVGVQVAASAGFLRGDEAQIAAAVRRVAESGARVTLVVAENLDIAPVADAADNLGLLAAGYAWIADDSLSLGAVFAASPDPDRTRGQLRGWLTMSKDALFGARRERFERALQSEPIQQLNRSVYASVLSAELLSGGCDQYCALAYDAVWTAAIAVGRVGVGADGSVDKEALLEEIRRVSFEGATGP